MGWPLKEKDLKRYPHFDAVIPLAELTRIATDPQRVKKNPFLPFLRYYKTYQPFRRVGKAREKKCRPIRYASRKDTAIFSYYRSILSERYEAFLIQSGIQDCPIAYRKIPTANGLSGKCNINFAAEAFADIRAIRNCCAVTLDISSYFESIDHQKLRAVWSELLGVSDLPPDHAAVFKAITQYAVVDRNAAYERLGYIGPKSAANGAASIGYIRSWKEMPIQLCTVADFRRKICGDKGHYQSLIEKHDKPFGIPQGIPISDLLANIYLMHFDERVFRYVRERGGVYYRYSDDIFIAIPGSSDAGKQAVEYVSEKILDFGSELIIKETKTSIVCFTERSDGSQNTTRIDRPKSSGGLEYLGFRFDGRKVYIRDSTLSRLHRKIIFAARRRARMLARRYADKNFDFLREKFDVREFESRYGRVADFERCLERRRWTFRTYVKRCVSVFGDTDGTFFRQLRGHRQFLARTVDQEIQNALVLRLRNRMESSSL